MSELFDDESIAIPCPGCGHEIPQTIRRLEENSKLTCPNCNALIDVDATELRKGLTEVDDAMHDLLRKLDDFGKDR